MLDAGNGSLSRLREFMDFRLLDGVIISHLHHDHYLDLYPLRHALEGAKREGERTQPLKVVAPSLPEAPFQELAGFKEAYEVTAIETLPEVALASGLQGRKLTLGSLTFYFVKAKHPVPTYSIAVEEEGRFVYSSDTAKTEEILKLATGADLFLCEASGLDSDAERMKENHLTARQAGEISLQAGVKRLLLTHIWPEYDPEALCRQATEGFGKPVQWAREREIYKIRA